MQPCPETPVHPVTTSHSTTFFTALRRLVAHAFPVLIAQLASVGMMMVDTVVLGHVGATDLAAVAIGGGIQVSIVFALVGILQAVAPMVAHRIGAGQDDEATRVLQHGLYLALFLALPGMALLLYPGPLLALAPMEPAVAARVREYLGLLAWGLPASLLYRTFYAFSNALGQARMLMGIGLAGLGLHALLAWGFGLRGWGGEPWGAIGCALANVCVCWLECVVAALWLGGGPLQRRFRVFGGWSRPQWPIWREMLRLGLPIGGMHFVEITAFTLIALLAAPLGAVAVAGHRVVASLAALIYMLPLSLAIATLAAVGQAVGARDWRCAETHVKAGLVLAAGLSTLLGLILLLAAETVVGWATDDPAVRKVGVNLVIYIAAYQFFDALQTVAGYTLRAYHVTFAPMLVQTVNFWGIGLGLGWWLCFRWSPPLGLDGFWLASVLSLVAAAAVLLWMLGRVMATSRNEPDRVLSKL